MTIEMNASTEPEQGAERVNDVHLNALRGIKTWVGRARYASEQNIKVNPWVATGEVRAWLESYGYADDNRGRVSTELNKLKKKLEIPTTEEIEAMTPEKLAELDAKFGRTPPVVETPQETPQAGVEVSHNNERLAPVHAAVQTPRSAPAEHLNTPESTPEPSKNDAIRPMSLRSDPHRSAAETKPERVKDAVQEEEKKGGAGQIILLVVAAILFSAIIIAPFALSANKIIDWAGSPQGLGLKGDVWPVLVFVALDAAAFACVCMVVYCAWRAESAGVFSWLIWAFAFGSAFANYRFSQSADAAPDAWWFFPAMSIAGPFLLEVVTHRVRKWNQEGTGQRARHSVSFGFWRWIPGVGSFRDTYGAWRVARLDGIDNAELAVQEYRRLCPDGKLNVLAKLRERDAR